VVLGSAGFSAVGTRTDDPNDRIAHQNRRELRGFGVFAAWVNDTDTFQSNTLDVYVGPPGAGHVVHYQQDVGGAFAVWAARPAAYWMGHAAFFSPSLAMRSILTLGFMPQPWEGIRDEHDRRAAESRELGAFSALDFDPRKWQPAVYHPAFARQTKRDRYWAAKRLELFTPAELRAAIAAGRYPPAVAEKLLGILWARRDRILHAYLGDLSAVDYFRVDRGRLCFDDLWTEAGLGGEVAVNAHEGRATLAVAVTGANERCAVLRPARVIAWSSFELGTPRVAKKIRRCACISWATASSASSARARQPRLCNRAQEKRPTWHFCSCQP
jgi:hypothetical protein